MLGVKEKAGRKSRMDDMDDDSNEEMPEMPPLETPLVDPHPELPPWNVALPDPESLGSSGSSSDSDLSVFEDTFNDIMKERQAEESGVIDSVIEDCTLEADDAEAEVIDTNTPNKQVIHLSLTSWLHT